MFGVGRYYDLRLEFGRGNAPICTVPSCHLPVNRAILYPSTYKFEQNQYQGLRRSLYHIMWHSIIYIVTRSNFCSSSSPSSPVSVFAGKQRQRDARGQESETNIQYYAISTPVMPPPPPPPSAVHKYFWPSNFDQSTLLNCPAKKISHRGTRVREPTTTVICLSHLCPTNYNIFLLSNAQIERAHV